VFSLRTPTKVHVASPNNLDRGSRRLLAVPARNGFDGDCVITFYDCRCDSAQADLNGISYATFGASMDFGHRAKGRMRRPGEAVSMSCPRCERNLALGHVIAKAHAHRLKAGRQNG
jgi:hypothetical protein